MRLTRVMLYVKDLPTMAAFYAGTLGFKPVTETRTDNWVEFETGSANLALHAIPPETAGRIVILTPPQPRVSNPMKLMFEVEDVESERRRLEALGVTFLQRPWGLCDALDPEGNIFQLSPMA